MVAFVKPGVPLTWEMKTGSAKSFTTTVNPSAGLTVYVSVKSQKRRAEAGTQGEGTGSEVELYYSTRFSSPNKNLRDGMAVLINGSTPPELRTLWEYIAVSSLHLFQRPLIAYISEHVDCMHTCTGISATSLTPAEKGFRGLRDSISRRAPSTGSVHMSSPSALRRREKRCRHPREAGVLFLLTDSSADACRMRASTMVTTTTSRRVVP